VLLIAVLATIGFAAVGTLVLLTLVKAFMGLRVTEKEERLGLDLSQHMETAYSLGITGHIEAPPPAKEPQGDGLMVPSPKSAF
jgi:hypothetical protein